VTRTFYTQSNRDNIMAFGDFTVTRASTKNVLGDAGLYVSVANDTPAFEFNTDGSYRGLLVEPGATNLALNSQDFTNVTWSKTVSASVTGNTGVAPDGTTTADTFTAGADGSQIQYSFLASAGVTYTASFFIRRITGTGVVNIRSVENVNTPVTITSSWQRYSVTATSTTTSIRIGMTLNTSGDAVEIWQAQLETGSVATSPIVTTAGTASRVADVVSLTGASSLIGQGAGGTLFIEFQPRSTGVDNRAVASMAVDGSNIIRLKLNASGGVDFRPATGGVGTTLFNTTATGITTVSKLAVGYKDLDSAMYFNGVQQGTTNTVYTYSAGSYANIALGSTNGVVDLPMNGWIRAFALFPTRLTNTQLQALTTP
jgi:hypothetical protein